MLIILIAPQHARNWNLLALYLAYHSQGCKIHNVEVIAQTKITSTDLSRYQAEVQSNISRSASLHVPRVAASGIIKKFTNSKAKLIIVEMYQETNRLLISFKYICSTELFAITLFIIIFFTWSLKRVHLLNKTIRLTTPTNCSSPKLNTSAPVSSRHTVFMALRALWNRLPFPHRELARRPLSMQRGDLGCLVCSPNGRPTRIIPRGLIRPPLTSS